MKNEIQALLPALRRYAYSLTGSMADADDLLQSTVERLLSRSVPENVALPAWAFRVCRNLWIDEHRARQVREKAVHDPLLQDAQVTDGEAQVHQQLTLEKVQQALATLKEEQKQIVSLVAVEGMSYKQVSETLGIPTGTVMSRLARARAALSNELGWAW